MRQCFVCLAVVPYLNSRDLALHVFLWKEWSKSSARSSFGCSLNSFVARSGCREQICLCRFSVRHRSRTTHRKGWERRRDQGERTRTPSCLSSLTYVILRHHSLHFFFSLLFSQAFLHLAFPPVWSFHSSLSVFPHCLYFSSHLCLSVLQSLSRSIFFLLFHVFFLLHEMHVFECPTLKG